MTAWDTCLVPWRLVIEQWLGQQIAAVVGEGGIWWEIRRPRGSSLGWTAGLDRSGHFASLSSPSLIERRHLPELLEHPDRAGR
uniref:DUF3363 domain-containing protein n=1 Tax=Acidovorax sp. DW039 TaxID=3095606 RepID=UPI00403FAF9A